MVIEQRLFTKNTARSTQTKAGHECGDAKSDDRNRWENPFCTGIGGLYARLQTERERDAERPPSRKSSNCWPLRSIKQTVTKISGWHDAATAHLKQSTTSHDYWCQKCGGVFEPDTLQSITGFLCRCAKEQTVASSNSSPMNTTSKTPWTDTAFEDFFGPLEDFTPNSRSAAHARNSKRPTMRRWEAWRNSTVSNISPTSLQ